MNPKLRTHYSSRNELSNSLYRILFLLCLFLLRTGSGLMAQSIDLSINNGVEGPIDIGQIVTVTVEVAETNGFETQEVDVVEVHIDFEPTVLEVKSFEVDGSAHLSTPIGPDIVDNDNGKLDFIRGTFGPTFPFGTFTFLTIEFEAIGEGTSSIAFTFDNESSPLRVTQVTAPVALLVLNTATDESITVADLVPTPVELTSFTARDRNKDIVLNWETQSEVNNDKFEIERSMDGTDSRKIGEVNGRGTSIIPHKYQFVDRFPQHGLNYYRLKQIDFDGTFDYSDVLVVQSNQKPLSIFPNPTKGDLHIEHLNIGSEKGYLNIYDQMGRVILQYELVERQEFIDISDFVNGIYTVEIITDKVSSFEKIIKF